MSRQNFILLLCLILFQSAATQAEEKHATGYIPEAPEKYAAMPKVRPYRAYLAPEKDLSGLFPKPGNQGNQGSCVAWATAYAARSYHEISQQSGNPSDATHIFSPAFVYNQLKTTGCDDGTSIADALELLKKTGVASLAEFPYDPHNCTHLPDARTISEAKKFRIDAWKAMDVHKLDDIKGQIFAGNPVIFGMFVSDSFDHLGKNQIYNDLTSPRTGGHAMVLVGYSEARQAFKLVNSWGDKWSDNGFGWISYQAIEKWMHAAFVMQLAAPTPTTLISDITPPTPIEKPVEPGIVAPPAPKTIPKPPAPPALVVIPPSPSEEPVEPEVVTPPAPKILPLSPSAELNRTVTKLIGGVDCADLGGTTVVDNVVSLKGFVGQRTDLEHIASELEAMGAKVSLEAKVRPWPQCEALLTLHDVLAKPSGLKLSVAGGDTTVLNEGEQLSIEVTTPNYPSYLYLTYIQANGDAVHLVRPQGQLPKPLAPNTHLVFGQKPKFTISAPFGDEMIVAIASASPLFAGELPKSQIERDYLTQFRQAFLVKPEPGAAERMVSAAMTTLVTRAKP
jgi:hypothetical protein